MKERDTRVLILTSEQCLKFGFAWVKGCEQGMHFCMVDKEEVIQLILNRLPEEATEAEEAEFETESGSEVQSADVDELVVPLSREYQQRADASKALSSEIV